MDFESDNVYVRYTVKVAKADGSPDVRKARAFRDFMKKRFGEDVFEADGGTVSMTLDDGLNYDGCAADDLPWIWWVYEAYEKISPKRLEVLGIYEVFVEGGKHTLLQHMDNFDGQLKTMTVDMVSGKVLGDDDWDFSECCVSDRVDEWKDKETAYWPVVARGWKFWMDEKTQKAGYVVARNPKDPTDTRVLLDADGNRITLDMLKSIRGEEPSCGENVGGADLFDHTEQEPIDEKAKYAEFDAIDPEDDEAQDIAESYYS